MVNHRWKFAIAAACMAAAATASRAGAQGTTTGAITGLVTTAEGRPLENAQIEIVNRGTGFRTGQLTRSNGRYFVQNLEIGPNYTVTVRLIGYTPQTREAVRVTLSQATRADFTLQTQAAQLSAVTVTASATADAAFSPTRQGSQTVVGDTLIQRIPNLDRNFTSLVRLTPQVTSQTGGLQRGGLQPAPSQFTIDGANADERFGLNSSETACRRRGRRPHRADRRLKECRSAHPTDVRLGSFATRARQRGDAPAAPTTLHGRADYTFRNPGLARDTRSCAGQPAAGAVRRLPRRADRARPAALLLRRSSCRPRQNPSGGLRHLALTGGPAGTPRGGPTGTRTRAQVARAQSIAQGFGINAGSPEVLNLETPLTNFIGRLDFRLNDNTRFVLRQLVNRAEQLDFSRNAAAFNPDPNNQGPGSASRRTRSRARTRTTRPSCRRSPTCRRGVSNEFSAAYNTIRDQRNPPIRTPEISVSARGLNNANSQITFGTEQFSPVNLLEQSILEITNNVTVPLEAHTLTFGARFESSSILNDFRQRSFGAYKFQSLDSLANRQPVGYSIAYANGPGIVADFGAQVYSAYAQDQWAVAPSFTVTGGVRMDVPRMIDTPADNPNISAGFAAKGIAGVSTTGTPKTRALFSPRLGVNWDVGGRQTLQLRANTGIYTGQPPYILIGNAYANTGRGLAFLNCSGAQTPAFTTDVDALPTACRGGTAPVQGTAGTAGVNLTDPNFRFPQRFVSTAGFDYRLPGEVVFSTEAIYGRDINGIRVRDLNITGPRLVGGQPYTTNTGRILYADTMRTNLTNGSTPITDAAGQRAIVTNGANNVQFGEGAIYLTNQSKAYNYSVTPTLRKRFGRGVDLNASYTYTRAFEVQASRRTRHLQLALRPRVHGPRGRRRAHHVDVRAAPPRAVLRHDHLAVEAACPPTCVRVQRQHRLARSPTRPTAT
jgi:hypothetical protein